MENYKKLYFYLFNQYTELIEQMKNVQTQAEEMYLQIHEPNETHEVNDMEVIS